MLELQVLGTVQLRRDGVALPLPIKKTQALLVLLACAGPTPRERAVALLWPALDEPIGRRNLRRELARLREAGAARMLQADGDRLALQGDVACDVQAFDAALHSGRPDDALALWRGMPAEGLRLDDAAAFEDWLALERERLQGRRRRALEALAASHEARGAHDEALQCIESLLADDPLQEQHHRSAMRLLAACGRREAAMAQYQRCRRLLKVELDLEPMAQTEALAASLRGAAAAGPRSTPSVPEPDATVQPAAPAPLLPGQLPFVGRRAEVASLEAAWQAGRALLIEGEAGVGKSRLACDFAAAHGPYALVQCRPGDAPVPYAAFARALRVLAGPTPEPGSLPPWVQGELARLLPEFGVAPPAPLSTPAESSRFIEACTQAWLALAADSFDAVILDDWHHADAASQTLLCCVAQRRSDQGGQGARELLVYRPELEDPAGRAVQHLRDHAGAVYLRLEPLAADAVLDLVQQLSGARRPQRFAGRLARATAGNPFFLAETLRHLAELKLLATNADGIWQTPFDEATSDYRELPLPASVHETVLARVRRMAAAAQRVLEAAALAGEPFVPALLAPACALSELETVLAIEQAVAARLLREHDAGGYAFAHDLVQQAIEAALPAERRRLVHRRLALGAEAAGAPAATVARHHEQSGDARRAVAHRLAAGDAAQRVHALVEAIAHWRQGLADGPTPSQALALHLRLMRTLLKVDQRQASMDHAQALRDLGRGGELVDAERAQAWLAVVAHLASNSREADALALLDAPPATLDERQQAQALAVRAMGLRGIGQIEASDTAARAALAMPGMQGLERANLLDSMVMNEHLAGRFQAALVLAEASVALCTELGDTHGVVRGMYRRGTFLLDLGDVAAAVLELGQADALCERYGFGLMRRGILYNLVCAHRAQSQPMSMLATAQRGWDLQPPLPPNDLRMMYRLAFVDAHLALGALGAAWDSAVTAVDDALALGTQLGLAATARTCAELFATLGERELPARLDAAISDEAMRQMPQVAADMWIARAQAAMRQGDLATARQALAKAPAADAIEGPSERARLALAQAELALAEGDARRATQLLPAADAPGMNAEMRLIELAIQVGAATGAAGLAPATAQAARDALQADTAHALAALYLHRALAAAQRAGVAGAPDSALRDCAAHVARLADSLAAHPSEQAAFQRAWSP